MRGKWLGEEVFRPAAPFAAAAFLALAVFPTMRGGNASLLPLAAGLTVAIGLAALFTPWESLPRWAAAIPAFAYFPVVALLRDAQEGAHSPCSSCCRSSGWRCTAPRASSHGASPPPR